MSFVFGLAWFGVRRIAASSLNSKNAKLAVVKVPKRKPLTKPCQK